MRSVLAGLLVLTGLVGAARGQSGPAQSGQKVRDLLESGEYAAAERASADLVAVAERTTAGGSPELAAALDLLVASLIGNGRSAAPSTLAAATRVVELRERQQGAAHLDVASSLHRLGLVYVERGEATLALPLHERALGIRARRLPPDDPAIAESDEYLAAALMQLERFDAAQQALVKAQPIREAHAGREPLALARMLTLQGWVNRNSGKYSASLPIVRRALELWKIHAPEHPDRVAATELWGDLTWLTGDIATAQAAWTEALNLSGRVVRPGHPLQGALERRVALAANALGNGSDARRDLEAALSVAEGSLAPCAPERAAVFADLATTLWYDGEYAQSYTLNRRAYETYRRCLGPNHSYTATVLYNQAGLANAIGDYVEAERLYERSIRIWSAALKPDHPFVARGLDNLAQVVEARGQYARSRALLLKALAIQMAASGPDHPDVAWTLTNLVRNSLRTGHLSRAQQYADRASAIYQASGAAEADHVARLLLLVAEIDERRGRDVEARKILEQALALRETNLGPNHPRTAAARERIAAIDFALGRDPAALAGALEAERDGRDQLRFTVRYLPERQGLIYADARPKGLDLALSLVALDRTRERSRVLDSVIRSRSVILDELAARSHVASAPGADLGSLNASLAAARQRYANLMLRSLTAGDVQSRGTLDEARQQKEDAERALAERSGPEAAELQRARAGVDQIRDALPAGGALVSYVRYVRRSLETNQQGMTVVRSLPSYLAFVLRPQHSDPSAVPLGSAASMDRLVDAWRRQMASAPQAESPAAAEAAYRPIGAALRRRVWDPLRANLAGAETVFVVPDGALNLVSFAALPEGGDRYLVEDGPAIHYLSAERDLVSAQLSAASTSRGLLAIGGAAFDDATSFSGASGHPHPAGAPARTRVAPARSATPARVALSCGSFESLRFQPLGGTRREVHEIAGLWTGSPSRILEGREATERRFKREAPGQRVLHLATHGFFLGGPCPPGAAGTRSIGGLSTGSEARPPLSLGVTPLLRSGLALAGANRRASARGDDEDGILTAEEVTGLNLEGVEWAVLSACDTGVGEVKAGEGVLGLRRAFQIAGVRTVIMSLWAVDDQAARLWMRALYEGRLQRKLSTAGAMHEATLGVLGSRRAHGQSTHPFYWAAFVAAGDWR